MEEVCQETFEQKCERSFETECTTVDEEECLTEYEEKCETVYKVTKCNLEIIRMFNVNNALTGEVLN